MEKDIFSSSELNWLNKNPILAESIDESLEDSLNVNPLDTGEPDLIPYQRALAAAHITIEAAIEKLITGPYDTFHFQMISKHVPGIHSIEKQEKTFWQLFDHHCACFREEDENWPKERIYMEAIKEMIRLMNESSLERFSNVNNEVANLNRGTLQRIKGKGVNAKYVE